MSASGLKVFDETLQVTNSWLKDMMEMLHTDDRQLAYRGLRAVLHALRDELEPEMAVHLAAQLPMLVRGFYYEGWKPSRTPTPNRHLDAFHQAIRTEMRGYPEVEPDRLMGSRVRPAGDPYRRPARFRRWRVHFPVKFVISGAFHPDRTSTAR